MFDLESKAQKACGFKSHLGHHRKGSAAMRIYIVTTGAEMDCTLRKAFYTRMEAEKYIQGLGNFKKITDSYYVEETYGVYANIHAMGLENTSKRLGAW